MRRMLLEGLARRPLTEKPPAADDAALAELAASLDRAARRRLGRSLAIREVDAGSCNGCELEIHALNNAFYDLERFGLRFVASPRHADVLLVTGPVTGVRVFALIRSARLSPRIRTAPNGCLEQRLVWAPDRFFLTFRIISKASQPFSRRLDFRYSGRSPAWRYAGPRRLATLRGSF
jgi:hypothetical protein